MIKKRLAFIFYFSNMGSYFINSPDKDFMWSIISTAIIQNKFEDIDDVLFHILSHVSIDDRSWVQEIELLVLETLFWTRQTTNNYACLFHLLKKILEHHSQMEFPSNTGGNNAVRLRLKFSKNVTPLHVIIWIITRFIWIFPIKGYMVMCDGCCNELVAFGTKEHPEIYISPDVFNDEVHTFRCRKCKIRVDLCKKCKSNNVQRKCCQVDGEDGLAKIQEDKFSGKIQKANRIWIWFSVFWSAS